MNKTTYANFHGAVNVFLDGGCVKSALNVFWISILQMMKHGTDLHN